jgi:Zn ribbon nucleic-acid-binding protein
MMALRGAGGAAMALDTSGEWWRGEDYFDLSEYLAALAEGADRPVDVATQSLCACGGEAFTLATDAAHGFARRTCVACGEAAFIGDSEDVGETARPRPFACRCGADRFEVAVAFSLRPRGRDVRWITVGARCLACGILDSPAEWEVDYAPSDHLLERA